MPPDPTDSLSRYIGQVLSLTMVYAMAAWFSQRLAGTAKTYGFTEIGNTARKCEQLVRTDGSSVDLQNGLFDQLQQLLLGI